jgi:16S rRNA (guanine966-N2)-methyltransferase
VKIIGGEKRGRVIKVPPTIRPTQDKVRAVIFNVLGKDIVGAKFMDLFAGSGMVGIEALSRGAREVFFIEYSMRVVKILKENIKSLEYRDKSVIIKKDVFKFLANYKPEESFIIFADPPYNKGMVSKLFQSLRIYKNLLIIEHSKHEPIDAGRHYRAGDTIVTFINY